MSDLLKNKYLSLYPIVLILGYVLGTAYFPPKTTGTFLTSHLLIDETIRIRSADAGTESFNHLVQRLYMNVVISGSSTWFDDELLESLGLHIHTGHESYTCRDGELNRFKKNAVAGLWYSPGSTLISNSSQFSQNDRNQPVLSRGDVSPATVLFIPDLQNSGQIYAMMCENYLIFTPKPENP